MRYLLDTHVIIWYYDGNLSLPESIKEIIDDSYYHCKMVVGISKNLLLKFP
jgi:PIN domain nuclease of toxin-antitoxin system